MSISFPILIMRFRVLTATAMAVLLPMTAVAADVQVIIDGKVVVFSDVPGSMWFATYVQQSADAGIVSGYKDQYGNFTGKFGPGKNITIAEALKIAVEGAGFDEDAYASKVPSGVTHWSSAYVSVAKSRGFPVIDQRVRLDKTATRAEVAALFTAAFGVDMENLVMGTRYDDVSPTTPYSASIEALSRDEVVAGDTDIEGQLTGTFRPLQPIVRAEVAKMVVESRAQYGTPGEGQGPDEMTDGNLVIYTNAGFSPQVLHVKLGETVTFRNDTTSDLWVASNPHPTHTGLNGFDADGGMGLGETYLYTFNKLGTFGYHNHLKSSAAATIIVALE